MRRKEARARRVIFTRKSLKGSSFFTNIEKATVLKGGNHSFALGGGPERFKAKEAAAVEIPSRFSERFSRFSKILTRHNHIALRQIRFRFIFSHDLPSDSLKWASCYQLTIQWHRSPNTCLYLHWESSLVRYSRKLGFLWKRNYEFPTVANREMTRNGNILSWAR